MKIELNENQMRLIATALEQYSRMICGQLEQSKMPSIEHAMWQEHYLKDDKKDMNHFCYMRDIVDLQLASIKKAIWGLDRNASWGIGKDDKADLGYEMYKEILHYFEIKDEARCKKEGKEYHWNVHTSEPLKLTIEPKIIIKD